MMRLPKFQYLAPKSVGEAASMLANLGPEAMPVSGGTDLYPNMKRRQFTPKYLVGLRRLEEIQGIVFDARGGLRIGAGASLEEVATSPIIREHYPALARAAGLISTPQLRTMGTLGGNLCLDTRCNWYDQSYFWRKAEGFCMKKDGEVCRVALRSARCLATASADTPPVLLAMDASVRLVSDGADRMVRVEDLYRDDGMAYLSLKPGEVVAEVIAPPPNGLRATYWKLRERGSFDFPIVGVCAAVALDASGICADARVILTAVTSRPFRATESEKILLGNPLTPEVISQAAEVAYKIARPVDNTAGTIIQRKRTVRSFVERALLELAGHAPVGGSAEA